MHYRTKRDQLYTCTSEAHTHTNTHTHMQGRTGIHTSPKTPQQTKPRTRPGKQAQSPPTSSFDRLFFVEQSHHPMILTAQPTLLLPTKRGVSIEWLQKDFPVFGSNSSESKRISEVINWEYTGKCGESGLVAPKALCPWQLQI